MAVATVTPAVSPAQLTVITSEEISRYAEITSQLSQLEALQKALRAELLDLHVAGAEQETGSLRNHIRKYQRCRSERCGPHMINHETSILQQMLRRIGTWERVGLGFQPLSLPKTGPGRCISDEEERRLIRAGASNPRWETVYMFALLSLNTTMGPGEVMHLRRKDIDLEQNLINVGEEGAKNRGRIRRIPLNEIGIRVCREALSVAEKKDPHCQNTSCFLFEGCAVQARNIMIPLATAQPSRPHGPRY